MTQHVERSHWLNTIVGILDSAFHLTDVEQLCTIDIVKRLLEALYIPERGEPARLPSAVALEVASEFYTVQLYGPRDSGVERSIRVVNATDMVVSIEAWRQALLGMLVTAYPDLEPMERFVATKILTDLLTAIGLPDRAASFFPDDVVRAYHDMPESQKSQ